MFSELMWWDFKLFLFVFICVVAGASIDISIHGFVQAPDYCINRYQYLQHPRKPRLTDCVTEAGASSCIPTNKPTSLPDDITLHGLVFSSSAHPLPVCTDLNGIPSKKKRQ